MARSKGVTLLAIFPTFTSTRGSDRGYDAPHPRTNGQDNKIKNVFIYLFIFYGDIAREVM